MVDELGDARGIGVCRFGDLGAIVVVVGIVDVFVG